MNLKFHLLFIVVLFAQTTGLCQGKKSIMKSWIKREVYNLSNNQKVDDTLYTRYTLLARAAYISFYPGWNDNAQAWNLSDNQLTIGLVTYTVENITDSTLTISIPGFRRIVLDDENYLNQKADSPRIVGQLDGEPVYEANKYITSRYKREDFRNTIQQNLEGYNIRKATLFVASFIVKKDGSVDNVHVIKGITDGFDAEVCKQLKKTSKRWQPALYKGQLIQTQMTYTIKYLDSIIK
jgi:hypothetical protein